MAERFNPRQTWDALDADQQRTIGEAALLLSLSSDANQVNDSTRRWEHAETEAWRLLTEVAPDFRDYPDGPDLAAIGIRACRECGCTDDSACLQGCSWIEADLCSACAPERDAA